MSDDLTSLIAQILKGGDLSPKMKGVTIGQLSEYLERQGFSLFVFMIGKKQPSPASQDNESVKNQFMGKYGLNASDIKTIKLCADGLTDEEIAEWLGNITAEGIRKRLKKIRKRVGASNKAEIVAIANKEKII
jgi:DNA-binding CsgD family transcriptional regulator